MTDEPPVSQECASWVRTPGRLRARAAWGAPHVVEFGLARHRSHRRLQCGYRGIRIGVVANETRRCAPLPDKQRQASRLPLLHNYQRPEMSIRGSMAPADRFRSAVQQAKVGRTKTPHVSAPIIIKYVTDLQLLGLLSANRQSAVPGHVQPERGEIADSPGQTAERSRRRLGTSCVVVLAPAGYAMRCDLQSR
jgi:hypothetical protein